MDEGREQQVLTGNRAGRSGFARRYARGLSLSAEIVRGIAGRVDATSALPTTVALDPTVVHESHAFGLKVYYHVICETRSGYDGEDVADGVQNAICGMRSLFVVDANGWPVWSAASNELHAPVD